MKTCVVIPTYNEAKFISGLIRQLKQRHLDVIVVDDGSVDKTSDIAKSEGATVLINPQNEGKGVSLLKGFEYVLQTNYDAVITMDGDGQHLPEDVPLFLSLAQNSDCAMIIGNRMNSIKNMPFVRVLTNRFMSWLISCVARQQIPDTQCGFRLIKKDILRSVDLRTRKFEAESEIIIKASRMGFKIESVPIHTVYSGEKSRINPIIDTLRFFRFLIGEL